MGRGKYIVCGEALNRLGDVFHESCFETKIKREETEDLQIGVKALIIISITVVIGVLIYNVIYQICRTRGKVKRQEKNGAKVTHTNRDCMSRQIREGTQIRRCEKPILNSKAE